MAGLDPVGMQGNDCLGIERIHLQEPRVQILQNQPAEVDDMIVTFHHAT